jgi:hypothetical protein
LRPKVSSRYNQGIFAILRNDASFPWELLVRLVCWRAALLALSIVSAFIAAEHAYAHNLELGLAGVSGGDDHADPAALVRFTSDAHVFMQGLLYGADFGPVSMRTGLVSFGLTAPVKGLERLRIYSGLTFMDEYVSIYSGERSRSDNTTQPKINEHNYNLGALLGVRAPIYVKSRFSANIGWESHLFIAGSAGLFLVLGVKQSWSLTAGMTL